MKFLLVLVQLRFKLVLVLKFWAKMGFVFL